MSIPLQVFYDSSDDRQLNVGGIGNIDTCFALTGDQLYWVVVEHRKRQSAFSTNNFDAVFLCTSMTYEAPAATARDTAQADMVSSAW